MTKKRIKDLSQDEAQKLLGAFKVVFDESGNNLPCGRQKCIELMDLLYDYFGVSYGDRENGFLNFADVRSVRSRLLHRCDILGVSGEKILSIGLMAREKTLRAIVLFMWRYLYFYIIFYIMKDVLEFLKKCGTYFVLAFITITLTGCKENSLLGRLGFFNIMDGDGMVRSAEDICLSFDGQVSETEDGEAICILSDEDFCYMFDIEDGGCDLLGYEFEYEGDMPSSVYCEENGGTYQIWLEGGEEQEVCTFDDDSFCYFDDLVVGKCSKGEFYYDEDEVEEYDAIYESCLSSGEDLVCGKDGNTYFNRCMMLLNGIEEETELAEIVDGECVFG